MPHATDNLVAARAELIVAAARETIGTPFHHQGRLIGVGLDCVGVMHHVAQRLDLPDKDALRDISYHRRPGQKKVRDELPNYMDEVPILLAEVGDVLAFWIMKPRNVQHVGVLTRYGLLHSYYDIGRVVEHAFGHPWVDQIDSAWRFRWRQ